MLLCLSLQPLAVWGMEVAYNYFFQVRIVPWCQCSGGRCGMVERLCVLVVRHVLIF